jgi:serine/threonine-protein kinase
VRPDDRYPNAGAMRRDLEAFVTPRVRMSSEALLVGFLRHRQKLTETEALAHLTQEELGVLEVFEQAGPRLAWPRWLAAFALAAAALGAGVLFTQPYWMGLVRQWTLR